MERKYKKGTSGRGQGGGECVKASVVRRYRGASFHSVQSFCDRFQKFCRISKHKLLFILIMHD